MIVVDPPQRSRDARSELALGNIPTLIDTFHCVGHYRSLGRSLVSGVDSASMRNLQGHFQRLVQESKGILVHHKEVSFANITGD